MNAKIIVLQEILSHSRRFLWTFRFMQEFNRVVHLFIRIGMIKQWDEKEARQKEIKYWKKKAKTAAESDP